MDASAKKKCPDGVPKINYLLNPTYAPSREEVGVDDGVVLLESLFAEPGGNILHVPHKSTNKQQKDDVALGAEPNTTFTLSTQEEEVDDLLLLSGPEENIIYKDELKNYGSNTSNELRVYQFNEFNVRTLKCTIKDLDINRKIAVTELEENDKLKICKINTEEYVQSIDDFIARDGAESMRINKTPISLYGLLSHSEYERKSKSTFRKSKIQTDHFRKFGDYKTAIEDCKSIVTGDLESFENGTVLMGKIGNRITSKARLISTYQDGEDKAPTLEVISEKKIKKFRYVKEQPEVVVNDNVEEKPVYVDLKEAKL